MHPNKARGLLVTGMTFLLVGLSFGCGGTPPNVEPAPPSRAMVLGQQPPGETPEPFAPGIVNTDAIELNGAVSPDGREFFFTRVIDDVFVMHRSLLREDGSWSDPEAVYTYPDRAPGLAVDMAHSPDGSRLYFLGRYSDELGAEEPNSDLFVMERRADGGWSLASALPAPVNTLEHRESYPSVVADGSLYFSSDRPGGLGMADIWRSQRLADGSFDEPVNLGRPVNSEHSEGDTYVAPDERWLVVTSRRPGGVGGGDLYVSFRRDDWAWSEPELLPRPINSDLLDYCPMGTPDGRFLFFPAAPATAGTTRTLATSSGSIPR